ncbi:MAG TPA: MmgE/PrpD family protein [Syntrophorhabdaceae bacterium]|nr:MmgE/PrpD family protein [Syntrophorhabdaceae bacterium]
MDATSRILQHIEQTQFHDLPEAVVENTKRFILDSIGVALAGRNSPGCREVVDLVKEWGGKPEAVIMSYGGKVPAPWAAMANSTMMHALDFDDTLDESALHAHVSVLPAALAAAESAGNVSGADLINAVVLGVDIVCRLGLSTKRPLSWIRTATCGTFGAAVAAGKIIGLDRERLAHVLGIAYSQTAGNAQCLIDGGLVKRMQPAFSAKSGVLSAFLAQKGITGARGFLEGQYGFFNLYESGDYDRERLAEGLGKEYGGMKLSIKPYPSCRMTHASIDAALGAKSDYDIDPSSIEEIVVHVSKMAQEMVGQPFAIRDNPQVDAQFSIPYTVATALLRGDVFLDDFEERTIRDARVAELAKKVRVVVDPALPERGMDSANLFVHCKGNIYSKKIDTMKGNPRNPLSSDECIEKFLKCVGYGRLEGLKDKTPSIIERVLHLEALENIGGLTALLA